jgi:hypothetical protein
MDTLPQRPSLPDPPVRVAATVTGAGTEQAWP